MCFAADDTISFFIVRIALCLSIMILGTILIRSSSSRICLIHPHLDTLFAPAMNSASIVDIAATACFFELHAIGRPFTTSKAPLVDFRSTRSPAQSASDQMLT